MKPSDKLLPTPPTRAQHPFPPGALREAARAFSPQLRDLPRTFPLRSFNKERFRAFERVGANREAALRVAETIAKLHPEDGLFLTEYARQLLANCEAARALDILSPLLDARNHDAAALSLAGYAHMLKGDRREALRLFGEALSVDPADYFSHINRRFAYRQTASQKPAPASHREEWTEVTVATSLPPRDVDSSRRAVNSWLELGFQVISVNTEEECRLLRGHFPDVRFCINNRTAKEITGKDHQHVDALLDALCAYGTDICAVINADIVLVGGREHWAQIVKRAKDGFIFTPRVNVNSVEDTIGHLYVSGFDAFFFPRKMPEKVPRTRFTFGQPFWDVFFPACAQLADIPTHVCYSPVALHKLHSINWDSDGYVNFGLHFLELFAPTMGVFWHKKNSASKYLHVIVGVLAEVSAAASRGNSSAFFCESATFDNYFAPVDPFYHVGGGEKILVTWGKTRFKSASDGTAQAIS